MLYRAVIAATFGRHSHNPYRTACVRLGSLLVTGSYLGTLLAKNVSGVSLPLTTVSLALTTIGVMQFSVLAVLLTTRGITMSGPDALARLLLIIPVTHRQRWLALLQPSIVVSGITWALCLPSLLVLMQASGLHPLLTVICCLVGTLSALGAIWLTSPQRRVSSLFSICLVVWAEYTLLGNINRFDIPPGREAVAALLLGGIIIVLCCVGIKSCSRLRTNVTKATRTPAVSGSSLSPAWWFIKKIVRSPATQLSLLTALTLGGGILVVLHRYATVQMLALPCSLLAAAAVTDVRSLSRRYNSAEMLLKGTRYFFAAQLIALSLFGTLAVVPMVIAGIALPLSTLPDMIYLVSHLALGIAAGCFAGTIIAPGQRDVSGQLLATLLCAGLVLAATTLPAVRSFSITLQTGCIFAAAATLVTAAYLVESLRNPYIWRKS